MPLDFTIVRSHPDLVRYAVDLQAKNSDALGFLPKIVFERGAEAGRLFLGLLNNQPCGYIIVGSGYQGILRCPQVCIPHDARRRLYGAALVDAVERYGESIGCHRRVVRCASDLAANEFWTSVGYSLVGAVESGAARKHRRSHLNIFTKPLIPAIEVTWDWLRREAGRQGGHSRSARKVEASRLNGRKGGRPCK